MCDRECVCVVSMCACVCFTCNYLCCEYLSACCECVQDRDKETVQCHPVQIYERWAFEHQHPMSKGDHSKAVAHFQGPGEAWSPVCQVWRATDRHKVRGKPCRCRWKCPLCQRRCHCGCGRLFLPRQGNGEASMNYLPLASTLTHTHTHTHTLSITSY